jgi:hypothetical protein
MQDDTLTVIECRGDPRAMGNAQGRELRSAIRNRVADAGLRLRGRAPFSLWPLIVGRSLGGGMGLEIVRHYAHLSERIQGLAVGAGLSIDSLMELFVRASQDALPGGVLAAKASVALGRTGDGGVSLSRALGVSPSPGSDWLVRRSVPEVGFASVELTLPWLATSVAGVNEAGIAAAYAPEGRSPGTAPSAMLLVQECLQRFESIEGCLDWAKKRPASGNGSLVVASASGAFANVLFQGEERRVAREDARAAAEGSEEVLPLLAIDPAARQLRVHLSPDAAATTVSVKA